MSRPRSERSRWVTVFTLYRPQCDAAEAKEQHAKAQAIIDAFKTVGRVVRVEPVKFGGHIVLKARRA